MDVDSVTLESLSIGATPLLDPFIERLQLPALLLDALGPIDVRFKLPTATTALLLIRNVALSRHPLYAVPRWLTQFVPEALGLTSTDPEHFNDDRIGRCLEQLYLADRPTLITRLIVTAVQAFGIDLSQLHNDSTTITFSGLYDERPPKSPGKPPKKILHGYNKDHRPDLKQLLFSLTMTADGNVPVHYLLLDGNTSDDQTHIQTWQTLKALRGNPEFIYVADSKLCTKENMAFISANRGRFLTVLPQTRAEDAWFKDHLQSHDVSFAEVLRRPNARDSDGPPDIYEAAESPHRSIEGYRIVWYRSSSKWERDRNRRQARIEHALFEIGTLSSKVGFRSLKTREQVEQRLAAILEETGAARWIEPVISERTEETFKQERPGRPGKDTRYTRYTHTVFELSWRMCTDNLQYDAKTDGLFPLITNIEHLSPQQLLEIHKQQPNLEKRHEQLKTVLEIAPVNLKTPERIEAFVCVYFIALLLHALIERELRRAMAEQELEAIPIYPEERQCKRPTTEKLFELFEPLRRHRLLAHGRPLKTFWDPLSDVHRQVLELLHISTTRFGE